MEQECFHRKTKGPAMMYAMHAPNMVEPDIPQNGIQLVSSRKSTLRCCKHETTHSENQTKLIHLRLRGCTLVGGQLFDHEQDPRPCAL